MLPFKSLFGISICPEENGQTEGLHCVQAVEGSVAKPYSFGKKFLGEFVALQMYLIFKIKGSGVCFLKMFTSYPITSFNVHSQCLTAPGGQDCLFGHKKRTVSV